MADMSTPLKNTAFTLSFTLYKNDGTIVANPGTYTKKVSVDGAAVADIAASVTEEDTTYGQLSLVLATGEMNGDFIWVYVTDNTAGTVPFTCALYPAAGNAYAEAALVHAHANTIDGHLTADYGATEKTCIDLLDDAAGGLADIHTDVGTAITNIGDVHATDLPAVKAVVDAVKVQSDKLAFTTANKVDARAFTVDDKTGYSGTATNMVAAAPDAAAVNAACDMAISDAALGTATNLAAVKTVVDEIPTNAELATALGTADDATLAAIVSLDAVVDTVKVDTAAILIDTGTTLEARQIIIERLLRNRFDTDPATGIATIYADDSTTPLYTANVYEDVDGTTPFDGSGANRRDRLA